MTSTDERDRYICQLYSSGWSASSIGREVGMSRSQVHRIVASPPDDDDDDDSDETMAMLEAMDASDNPDPEDVVEPLTYVGEESGCKRYLDAKGRSLMSLATTASAVICGMSWRTPIGLGGSRPT